MATDLSCKFPSNYDELVSKKVFSSEIVYRRGVLEKFLCDIDDYKGPFKKSMFLDHRRFIAKLKEVGVNMVKSKRNRMYYINEEREPEPVLFDTGMLDVVEDEEHPEQ